MRTGLPIEKASAMTHAVAAMGEIPAAASSDSALELVSGAEMFRLLVVAITSGENGAVDTLESAIKLF